MKERNYKTTLGACFLSYICQATVVNLPPLLFVIFADNFNIGLNKIGLLIIIGFSVQILTDLVASKFAVKIGYRICAVSAHVLCAVGIIMLGVLPLIMPAYAGLVIAFVTMSIGGGLLEVLISPIVDALPSKSKSGAMSLLHSFYCWGAVAVILLTTLYFLTPAASMWWLIPVLWSVIPIASIFMFSFVPFPPREEEARAPYKKLFLSKIFWVMFLLMIAAGAAEQSISQWASLFAEMGLKVNKTTGNLLGACSFAVLMGVSRVIYGIFGTKLKLKRTLLFCGILTVVSYCMIVFIPNPIVNLLGCALCGLGVGVAWPGVLSLASRRISFGGTTMFALLALGGDVGCAIGPGIVGLVSDKVISSGASWFNGLFGSGTISGLKSGIMIAVIFPIIFVLAMTLIKPSKPKIGAPLYNAASPNNINCTSSATNAETNSDDE